MSKSKEIKSRIIRLQLSDGRQINGRVNINRGNEGYDRLSDLIGDSKVDFLVLFQATEYRPDSDNPIQHKVMFINKHYIVTAVPDDDQK